MEVSGAVLRRAPLSSGVGLAGEPSFSGYSAGRRTRVSMRPRGVVGGGGGFSDHGHLRYYLPPVKCGGGKKEEKKRAKLVKGLSKDLSAFYSMGFGVDAGDGMVGDVKGKMMTEAAELLLSQLKQLKAEEKELKKNKKQEKAAMKAAARMKDPADSSSGSSSESSDSECETVVKMKTLGTAGMIQAKPDIREISTETPLEPKTEKCNALSTGPECCSSSNVMFASKATDKIEVCMGGKCKKSGASELLMEFEKMVGMEGAVVGCKCMGKCRDGPNVRVLNHSNQGEGDPVKDSRNPLCIGVGLEDVGAIVSNFFGDNKDVGLLAA